MAHAICCKMETSCTPVDLDHQQFFTLFSSKRASRHNGVHFSDISTSKSAPYVTVFFYICHLQMCFAPQRHALFRHGNLKVVRCWCVLCILTSKCASRHNGVHFSDISTSKSAACVAGFHTFHFQLCFATQLRALLHPLNVQKWSKNDASLLFDPLTFLPFCAPASSLF